MPTLFLLSLWNNHLPNVVDTSSPRKWTCTCALVFKSCPISYSFCNTSLHICGSPSYDCASRSTACIPYTARTFRRQIELDGLHHVFHEFHATVCTQLDVPRIHTLGRFTFHASGLAVMFSTAMISNHAAMTEESYS
jgi:hypothetical protein